VGRVICESEMDRRWDVKAMGRTTSIDGRGASVQSSAGATLVA